MDQLERKYALDEYIYFHKEVLTKTRDNRPMYVITLSSRLYMTKNFEPRFNKLLFPVKDQRRPRQFDPKKKKYVYITARVHPGETAGSYVFNGAMK